MVATTGVVSLSRDGPTSTCVLRACLSYVQRSSLVCQALPSKVSAADRVAVCRGASSGGAGSCLSQMLAAKGGWDVAVARAVCASATDDAPARCFAAAPTCASDLFFQIVGVRLWKPLRAGALGAGRVASKGKRLVSVCVLVARCSGSSAVVGVFARRVVRGRAGRAARAVRAESRAERRGRRERRRAVRALRDDDERWRARRVLRRRAERLRRKRRGHALRARWRVPFLFLNERPRECARASSPFHTVSKLESRRAARAAALSLSLCHLCSRTVSIRNS